MRKEQLRKEREARELLDIQNVSNQRDRRVTRSRNGLGSRHPSGIGTRRATRLTVATKFSSSLRPQLSPMLFKTDSLANVSQVSPMKSEGSDSGNTSWEMEEECSPPMGKIASVEISVTPDVGPSVPALIAIPRNIASNEITRVPVSPLCSRNRM